MWYYLEKKFAKNFANSKKCYIFAVEIRDNNINNLNFIEL